MSRVWFLDLLLFLASFYGLLCNRITVNKISLISRTRGGLFVYINRPRWSTPSVFSRQSRPTHRLEPEPGLICKKFRAHTRSSTGGYRASGEQGKGGGGDLKIMTYLNSQWRHWNNSVNKTIDDTETITIDSNGNKRRYWNNRLMFQHWNNRRHQKTMKPLLSLIHI